MSSTVHPHARAHGEENAPVPLNDLFLTQERFLRWLYLERRRTERSSRRFVLMLLEAGNLLKSRGDEHVLDTVLYTLCRSTRETDVRGWYETGSVIGVIFTEIGSAEGRSVANALLAKISKALGESLRIEQINEITLSFHVFPEDWDHSGSRGPADPALYPDLFKKAQSRTVARVLKRSIDVVGSVSALIMLSPLLAAIAAAIKLTSRGPVLFRQERIGQYGRRFTFLKFRSMHCDSDPKVHEDYVKEFISGGNGGGQAAECSAAQFKLTADPRITPVGKLLRRASLDELPQFVNVLAGDMSLVGPRPPILYEFRRYDLWHKRRLLAVKPGITGLWQVEGRSRVPFNEMVRMDLKYASSWSLWMDFKILLRTPAAVFSGEGAY